MVQNPGLHRHHGGTQPIHHLHLQSDAPAKNPPISINLIINMSTGTQTPYSSATDAHQSTVGANIHVRVLGFNVSHPPMSCPSSSDPSRSTLLFCRACRCCCCICCCMCVAPTAPDPFVPALPGPTGFRVGVSFCPYDGVPVNHDVAARLGSGGRKSSSSSRHPRFGTGLADGDIVAR